MWSFDFIALISAYGLLGCFVGFMAGLLGIGGGTILVPALYYLFQHFGLMGMDSGHLSDDGLMHIALATSMAVIFPTGLSSSWAQIKRGAVDWNVIHLMAGGLMLGAVLGVFIVTRLDGDVLKVIFAVGLYGVAASIFFGKENKASLEILKTKQVAFPVSVLIGGIAVLMGQGGAVMNVPYLSRGGWPMKTAIACSSVLGMMLSVPAILTYMLSGEGVFGYIHPLALLIIAPVSILFAPLGVRVSHQMPVKHLRLFFAVFLVVVASKMAVGIIS